MTPYRKNQPPSEPSEDLDAHDDLDDRVLLWFLLVVGLVRTVVALVQRQTWGAEPTVLLLLGMLAGAELVRNERARRHAARKK